MNSRHRTRALTVRPDELMILDHGAIEYQATVAAVDRLIIIVQENNFYRQSDPQDHERRLTELEAGRRLLGSKTISLATLKAVLVAVITYLALKFADAPIGEAATAAWNTLKTLFGL